MANLKGGDFQKQIRNALIRLDSRGVKRYGTNSRLTHSNSLYIKREMYLKDFSKFLLEKGLSKGKLNNYFTDEHINNFLNERLQNLNPKTSLDYCSGFNSMLQGLRQTHVDIDRSAKTTLREFVSDYRMEFNEIKNQYETGRAIRDIKTFLTNLEEIRESSSIIADLQLQTGLRVAESLEVAKNFNNYYQPQTSEIMGVVGKGGQEYYPKTISQELADKLNNLEKVPSYSTYYQNLKELGHKPHNLRITFAKKFYEKLKKEGYSNQESLKKVSIEMNHHREAITNYYLSRA